MTHYRKLVGEKCYLSPVALEDAEAWARWFNDLDVALPLGDEAYLTMGLERLRADADHVVRNGEHVFSILDLATDTLIGRGLLFSVNAVDRNAMLGLVIGEKQYWGQGYGLDATRLLLEVGFSLLNLHSIMLGAFAFNQRALNCYRRAGFKEIGRRRQARLIGGVAYDAVLMDILAEEFSGGRLTPPAAG